jgi:Protein of unknown function (DUF2946)
MRRRLRKLFPIVLLALTVQIFAPIAACWAAGLAASDPLASMVICHDNGAASPSQTDPTGQPGAHAGCCSVCSMAHTGSLLDAPPAAIASVYGQSERVVWPDTPADWLVARSGSQAQARAPPHLT